MDRTIDVQIKRQLSKLIVGKPKEEIDRAVRATANIVIREMMDQAPVNEGDGRRSIKKTEERTLLYKVAPTVITARGFRYMDAVATGTNKWRNSPYDFGERRGGWVRQARYSDEEILLFMMIQKRTKGRGISIPPNQYDVRAKKVAEPKVLTKVVQLLNNIDVERSKTITR